KIQTHLVAALRGSHGCRANRRGLRPHWRALCRTVQRGLVRATAICLARALAAGLPAQTCKYSEARTPVISDQRLRALVLVIVSAWGGRAVAQSADVSSDAELS